MRSEVAGIVEIDHLLRKLRPLIPGDVKRWTEAIQVLDPDARRVLEQHIHARAADLLGESERKVLLPPPPRAKARGMLRLGEVVYEGLNSPFGLDATELLQGLGLYGRSGSGKTTVVFALLRQLARKRIHFLFLDWKRTCRHVLPSLAADARVCTPGRSVAPLRFNPLIPPPGMETRAYITQVVDVLAGAYTLGDGARNVLQRELLKAYQASTGWPTLDEVLQALEEGEASGRARGWRESAIRAIQSLTFSGLQGSAESSQVDLMSQLQSSSSVIELDGLGDNDKRAIVPLLMQWLFQARLQARTREKLELVIIIEEAHHLLYRSEHRSQESLMNQFLRQCRELGIGVVIVDQHPHLISSAALGNTFTSICLNLTEPTDVNRAAALTLLPSDEKRYIGMLPVGQGIVRMQNRWHAPFLVRFDHVPVEKGAVTDDVLRRCGGRLTRSPLTRPGRPGIPRAQRVRATDVLSPEAFLLLMDVFRHPLDGVRRRYERLGVSMQKGGKLKEELLAEDWAVASAIPVGRTRRLVLAPSRHARRTLAATGASTRASVEHGFWQHYWAARLRREGYRATVEAPRSGGRVDVLAESRERRVAVEIETGKSDAVRNVQNCLRSRIDHVLVVATSKSAERKVTAQLGRAGLLADARVVVGTCSDVKWNRPDGARSAGSDLAHSS